MPRHFTNSCVNIDFSKDSTITWLALVLYKMYNYGSLNTTKYDDLVSRVPRFRQSDFQGQPISCSEIQGYYPEDLKITTSWNIYSN